MLPSMKRNLPLVLNYYMTRNWYCELFMIVDTNIRTEEIPPLSLIPLLSPANVKS